MLITPELLRKYNGIHFDEGDREAAELVAIHIGTAQQIISDYVGFNCEDVLRNPRFTEAERSLFKTAELRIATLLQMEGGGNIGVNTAASGMGVSRSYLNVTDYTQYLKPLSAFRRNGGVF